ncbi:hypothetical protein [Natronolimnobius baerhuensis]|uniref:Uncharacterized protein n=1 Tax=Natronolimnobius baerhuensis TaxID=253108 RepID=A0A202ED42_9EURY|nr:hypothetical protein [Natronolimnobius baerhuensis]OVE86196.1 hypothetical protein B2G88_05260 [Natronolimnobius baerhuensis]
MKVIFKPGNADEEINCVDFREYEQGIVPHNEEGYNIGYVPHEILSHIEPHSGEEVVFEDGEKPVPGNDEDE